MNEAQKNNQQEPLRILVFSASLRNDSLNTRLAKLAASVIEKNGAKVDFANMSEFDCPSFNQDLEINNFHPAGAEEFRKRILANDATPELIEDAKSINRKIQGSRKGGSGNTPTPPHHPKPHHQQIQHHLMTTKFLFHNKAMIA